MRHRHTSQSSPTGTGSAPTTQQDSPYQPSDDEGGSWRRRLGGGRGGGISQEAPDWLEDLMKFCTGLCRLYLLVTAGFVFSFYKRCYDSMAFFLTDLFAAVIVMFFFSFRIIIELGNMRDRKTWAFKLWILSALLDILAFISLFAWISEGYKFFLITRLYHCYFIHRTLVELEHYLSARGRRAICVLLIYLLATHAVACIFYSLATTEQDPANTWLGSLEKYSNFTSMGVLEIYVPCYYFAATTLTTVGYGDMHPVNPKEMGFTTLLYFGNLILLSYVSGLLDRFFAPPVAPPVAPPAALDPDALTTAITAAVTRAVEPLHKDMVEIRGILGEIRTLHLRQLQQVEAENPTTEVVEDSQLEAGNPTTEVVEDSQLEARNPTTEVVEDSQVEAGNPPPEVVGDSQVEAGNSSSQAIEQMPSSSLGSQTTFTYEQLRAKSNNPVTAIDIERREAYLSEEEFQTVFGVTKETFYKLPRWKQINRKKEVGLF